MDALIHSYEGDELVIPRELIELLGVKPGESIVIRAQPESRTRELTPSEREKLVEILGGSQSSLTEQDASAHRKQREAMWATWKLRD